jgi:cytochrome c biogenesis factor
MYKENKMKNNNILMVVLVIVLVLLLFGGFGMRSFGIVDVSNFGFQLINGAVMLLLIVLIVLGIFWLIKNLKYNERRTK